MSVRLARLVLPGLHHFCTGGALLVSVLLFFTNASEELLLIGGEKCPEWSGGRSDLHPARTPLLHNTTPLPPHLGGKELLSPRSWRVSLRPWRIPPQKHGWGSERVLLTASLFLSMNSHRSRATAPS